MTGLLWAMVRGFYGIYTTVSVPDGMIYYLYKCIHHDSEGITLLLTDKINYVEEYWEI